MSKYNNVKPDHFKTAGREPQGQDVIQDAERQQYAEAKVREKRNDPRTARRDLAEPASENIENRQGVSSKRGKRSSAKKMESTRHNFDTIPPARKPAGASGSKRSK